MAAFNRPFNPVILNIFGTKTGFVEDSFSTHGGPGGGGGPCERWGMDVNTDEAWLTQSSPWLCSQILNRPQTGTSPWPGVLGPPAFILAHRSVT